MRLMLIDRFTVEPGYDYVEGSFPTNSRPEKQPFAGAGFDDDSFDAFQHHFGGFFGGNVFNPFGNFGGIGFGPVESYKPWYKG